MTTPTDNYAQMILRDRTRTAQDRAHQCAQLIEGQVKSEFSIPADYELKVPLEWIFSENFGKVSGL